MILRNLLLYLSTERHLRGWMETSSVAARLTKRFVAGETLSQALDVCRSLHSQRVLATLDHLGESVRSAAESEESRDAYLRALAELTAAGLNSTVSIKLSQFGMEIDRELCRRNVERLVSAAAANGQRVEIDIESSPWVDATLDIAREMHARYGCVRVAVQAYLHRSRGDIERLCEERIPVRLCKGAYKEPPEAAIAEKSGVDANYRHLAVTLLERGHMPALATHDPKMIDAALDCVRKNKIAAGAFEFQMLYGIRRDLQRRLVAAGFTVRLYVPYGVAWYPYFMRRLAERPANLLFLMRNMLRR